MRKEILIACICASLMLITPFTVVAQENKISNNLTEKPDVESLVTQIRELIDEILEKYGHIPMVSNLGNMILNTLDSFGLILFCISLLILMLPLGILTLIFIALDSEIVYWFGVFLLMTAMTFDSNCAQFWPLNNLKLPLKSIYTLTEINDISELDCPCLQE